MSNPRVSVIVPVFNRANTIGQTLHSIWGQTLSDLEVILVDDGSTDDLDVALDDHGDQRLRVLRQNNSGPAAARNAGVDAARGQLIAYLDSDDIWLPEHLTDVVGTMFSVGVPAIHAPMIVDRGVGRFAVKPTRAMHPDETFGHYRFVAGEPLLLSTLVVEREVASGLRWDERLFFGDVDQYVFDLVNAVGPIHMHGQPTALYSDVTGPQKLSQLWVADGRTTKYTSFLDWVDEHADNFSATELAAHRARNEACMTESATGSARVILPAYRMGAIGLGTSVRELIRARRPMIYRYLVDTYVYLRGNTLAELLPPRGDCSSRVEADNGFAGPGFVEGVAVLE